MIGVASALIDNAPLVTASTGIYDLQNIPVDASLWQMITFWLVHAGHRQRRRRGPEEAGEGGLCVVARRVERGGGLCGAADQLSRFRSKVVVRTQSVCRFRHFPSLLRALLCFFV